MLKDKIKNLAALKKIIARLKRQGRKTVFTNGCFDLLHYGHVKYLEDAKRKGGILIVAINSDESVKKLKGKGRPVINESDRLSIIAALESVDYVFSFRESTPLNAINELRPDVLVKGADWNKGSIVGSDIVRQRGGKVLTIKLAKGRSTTGIIKKITGAF